MTKQMPPGVKFKRGEENISALLTPELVQKMRQLQAEGWSYRKLADEFDVDPNSQKAKDLKDTFSERYVKYIT